METNRVKQLYKFASLESAEKIIIGRKLKFTNPKDFNDPFDCNIDRIEFDLSKTDKEFEAYDKRIREQAYATHGEKLNGFDWSNLYQRAQIEKIRKSKVCCFSTINDHPLLWSHYGEKHRGVCLIFDNSIDRRFTNEEKVRIGIEGLVEYKEFKKTNFCESRIHALAQLFCVKGRDWKYEHEYRMITLDPCDEYVEFVPNFLTGIIFGMRVTNKEIGRFKKAITDHSNGISFKVAIKKNESLEIMDWNLSNELLNKDVKVVGLSTDSNLRGLFERLRSE